MQSPPDPEPEITEFWDDLADMDESDADAEEYFHDAMNKDD